MTLLERDERMREEGREEEKKNTLREKERADEAEKQAEEAKKQVGFVVDDSKLLVEAYSTQDGFFIITFTKFNTTEKQTNNKRAKKMG